MGCSSSLQALAVFLVLSSFLLGLPLELDLGDVVEFLLGWHHQRVEILSMAP
jgi:hypothetical protein